MPQGTVKMFRTDKSFGFIAPDEDGADVYIQVSELEKTGLSSVIRLLTGNNYPFYNLPSSFHRLRYLRSCNNRCGSGDLNRHAHQIWSRFSSTSRLR
jgi:'Cold-shock' DNA-binding domain